jgi:hypothetical protein
MNPSSQQENTATPNGEAKAKAKARVRAKKPGVDAGLQWVLDNLGTANGLHSWYGSTARALAQPQYPLVSIVFLPPNDNLRLFPGKKAGPELNAEIKSAIQTVMSSIQKKDDPQSHLVFDFVVRGKLAADGSPEAYWYGVSTAPTMLEASKPEYFVPVPENLLTHLLDSDVKIANRLDVYAARPHGPSLKQLIVGDTTFDWPAYDPRYVVSKFIKNKRPKPVEADPDAPVLPTLTSISPMQVSLVQMLSSDARLKPALSMPAPTDITFADGQRVSYFSANFAMDLGQLTAATATEEGQPFESKEVLKAFVVNLKPIEFTMGYAQRWQMETGATVNTATVETAISQQRADVEHGRADMVHTETEYFATTKVPFITRIPCLQSTASGFVKLLMASDKLVSLERGHFPEAAGSICAITGKPILGSDAIKIVLHLPGVLPGMSVDQHGGCYVRAFCKAVFFPAEVALTAIETPDTVPSVDFDMMDLVHSDDEEDEEEKKKEEEEKKKKKKEKKMEKEKEKKEKEEPKKKKKAPAKKKPEKEQEGEEEGEEEEEEEVVSPKKKTPAKAKPQKTKRSDLETDPLEEGEIPQPPTKKQRLAFPSTPFVAIPKEWSLPAAVDRQKTAVHFSQKLINLATEANASGPSACDDQVRDLLASSTTRQELLTKAKANRDFESLLVDTARLIAYTLRAPDAGEPILTVSYPTSPAPNAFQCMPHLYAIGMRLLQQDPDFLAEEGPYSPEQLAVARVLFWPLK